MTDPGPGNPKEKPVTGEGERIAVLFVHGKDSLLMKVASSPELDGEFRITSRGSADEALTGDIIPGSAVIVSACQLLDMDGISFLRKVRQQAGNIPFIYFARPETEETIPEVIRSGADFCLYHGEDSRVLSAELAFRIRQAVGRSKDQDLLRSGLEKYRIAFLSSPDAIVISDMETGKIVEINEAATSVFGYLPGELIGRSALDLGIWINPEDRDMFIRQIRTDGRISQFELKERRKNGETFKASVSAGIMVVSGREYLVSTIQDITRSSERNEEVKQSVAILRSVVESPAGVVIFALDREFRYLAFNENHRRTMKEIWGADIAPGISMLTYITDSEDREKARIHFERTLSGESFTITEMYGDTARERRWYEDIYAPIWDEKKTVIGLTVFLTDITGRIEREEAIRESEERFSRFADHAPDLLFRISIPDGRYEYISPACLTLCGYSPEEFYRDPGLFPRIIHPSWHEYFLQRWEDLLKKKVPHTYEFQIIDRQGTIKWVNQRNVLVAGPDGEPVALEGIVTDITGRKNAERELRRSEQRFHAVTMNAGSWVWEINPEGVYTYCSPAVGQVMGYTPDELVGKVHFYDLFDPSGRDELKASSMKAFGTQKPFQNIINPNLHKDGSRILLRTSGTPVYDDDGHFTGYCGVDQDITREKEAEELLIRSEAQYRLLADNVHDVIWTTDRDLRFTYISPSILNLTGYSSEESLHRPFQDFLTPDSYARVREASGEWMETIRAGRRIPEKMVMELEFRCKNGSIVWTEILMTMVFDSAGTFTGIVGVTRDINTRKKAEEALRESEEKFRSFVESANELVYSLNPDGIISYVSPRVCVQLGYEIPDFIGKSSLFFVHPDDQNLVHDYFIQSLTLGKNRSGLEYRLRHRDGTWLWHSQSFSPIYDNEGDLIRVLGISHDITERKNVQEVIRRANRQLNLLTGITRHDILNKTTLINGYLTLAEMDPADPHLPDYIGKMKEALHEIRSHIEFTRVYDQIGSQEPQWLALQDVMPMSSLPESVRLTPNVPGVYVYADPMLEKVFFDLLDNSLRHGGHVTDIRVFAYESDTHLIVVWEDNGTGIPENEKEQIFERGFGKNTGLGMFLVREILLLTDITIRERGVYGQGARFELMVPGGAFRRDPAKE